MKVVEREINARERAAASSCPSVKRQSREPPTAATLMSTDTSTICAYCDQVHHSSQCRVVADVKLRKRMLMKAGRCFLCLKMGHLSKSSRSSAKCSSCQRRHHSSICENVHTPSDANPAKAAVSTPSNAQVNPAQRKTVASHHPSSLSMYASTKTPVLLQTATAMVYRPDSPTITEITRVILDGGSQRSYITGRLRELPTQSSELLVIKMFGSEGGRAQTCDLVRLGVRTRDGTRRSETSGGTLDLRATYWSTNFLCQRKIFPSIRTGDG